MHKPETNGAGRDRSVSPPGRPRLTPAGVVVRATRSHTVEQALSGLGIDRLPEYKVKDLPAEGQPAGYAMHDTRHPSGAVVAVLTACGPDRTALLARLRSHLEQPSVGYSVEDLEGLAEHQFMIRRANADELRQRRALATEAPTDDSAAAARSQRREELEEAGQESLF
ncbi:hypothetical protein OIU91_41165 (plasmid) [Streptomyces sp. NBC_01456]|uniref:hypothetical protein n=1 Tax=unclassified Streptomyces TaxID=2593676 RepID=UPI002E362753|nr:MULTISPECIES: hypothetical protein [unclassified Streptomyces]